jgi:hypothetical protein
VSTYTAISSHSPMCQAACAAMSDISLRMWGSLLRHSALHAAQQSHESTWQRSLKVLVLTHGPDPQLPPTQHHSQSSADEECFWTTKHTEQHDG